MPTRRTLLAGAVTVLAAAGLGATGGTAAAAPADGPRATYIVTVDGSTLPTRAAERARDLGGRVKHLYTAALRGYAVDLPEAAASKLAAQPGVTAVERDQVFTATAEQAAPPWGLDRIDQKGPLKGAPLDGTYHYSRTGAGVTAYVIDTGILTTHSEFGTRASVGADQVRDGENGQDCNGHGTHVAGTIGGTTYGVAKDVSLVAVRVLGCDGSGSTSGVIAGVNWIVDHHEKGVPALANMSLSGPTSSALDSAVSAAIGDGVVVAVAAGNGNQAGVAQDACKSSPARVPDALTVGASDTTDRAASWSNYGKCVDLFAPGVGVQSAWHTSTEAKNTISGTSMATPHVAGVAALYLQAAPTASPTTVATQVRNNATQGVVTNTRTAENDVLYTGFVAPATT